VNSQLPLVKGRRYGYDQQQVDAFISMARQQYENPVSHLLSAERIRETEFDLVRGGYQVSAVDSALDRIEDALADREIQRKIESRGVESVRDLLVRLREIVQSRAERPKRKRFEGVTWPSRGYSKREVDKLCNLILEHIINEEKLTMAEVRRIVFSAQRGGYAENQVDAFIDRVVQILHIERNS
jgi:DivIVA domain-containing protein